MSCQTIDKILSGYDFSVGHFESNMVGILTQNLESAMIGAIAMQDQLWTPESITTVY